MGNIVLQRIGHSYGGNRVLRDVELEIRQGELFTLLGPSGCGKTTILRILAGFLFPTEGRILIEGKDVTKEPPEKRGMGVVFQNYALFPNMTVEENILYGLKVRRSPKEEMEKKCQSFLELTGLSDYRDRRIDQLSGGQQQRVAIARALIVEPKMLLLDEPLSNLDVALRVKMREEIQEIQRKTGVTTLFITHDQQEALSISHRIAVLDHGVVQQVGTPQEIYNRPANRFVADFVGVSNWLTPEDCKALKVKEGESLRPERLCLLPMKQEGMSAKGDGPSGKESGLPAEGDGPSGKNPSGIPVQVQSVQFEGPYSHYTVASQTGTYQVLVLNRGGDDAAFPVGSQARMAVGKQR